MSPRFDPAPSLGAQTVASFKAADVCAINIVDVDVATSTRC